MSGLATDSAKPRLKVVHGQPSIYSTSFQTRRLAESLSRWFAPAFITVSQSKKPLLRALYRVIKNYVIPFFTRPSAPYILYCNDGAVDLRHWKGTRLIYWYDAASDWTKAAPRRRNFFQWLRYQNVLEAEWVFAVSAAQVRIARALRPGREASVVYLPVGVDCSVFDPAVAHPERVRAEFKLPQKTIVGYLGYLGIFDGRFAGEVLLEIATRVVKERDVHFLIVGFGPAFGAWKDRVAALGLSDHFTFTGYVADELVPHCIAAMDVCIDTLEPGFHSEARSETKLKQYMAMGRACVATAIGENCVDMDDGHCGVLVPPGADGLLAGVTRLLGDPALRKSLGDAARKRAFELYNWPVLAEKMATQVLQFPGHNPGKIAAGK